MVPTHHTDWALTLLRDLFPEQAVLLQTMTEPTAEDNLETAIVYIPIEQRSMLYRYYRDGIPLTQIAEEQRIPAQGIQEMFSSTRELLTHPCIRRILLYGKQHCQLETANLHSAPGYQGQGIEVLDIPLSLYDVLTDIGLYTIGSLIAFVQEGDTYQQLPDPAYMDRITARLNSIGLLPVPAPHPTDRAPVSWPDNLINAAIRQAGLTRSHIPEEDIRIRLSDSLTGLPPIEDCILRALYQDGQSPAEISELLCIKEEQLPALRDTALEHLGHLLLTE